MLLTLAACSEASHGTLEVRVVDPALGEPVPVRLEVLNQRGEAWVARRPLLLSFECIAAARADRVG